MKKNKFLSALLAPMLYVSGSAMALEKSSDTETVRKRSYSVNVNSSDVVAKCLISSLVGAGIGAASVGLPLKSQKNGLQETLVNLEKDKQDYEVLKRDHAKLEEKCKTLEREFGPYKSLEKYFNGDRNQAANMLKLFVEFMPYFMNKNGNPTGKLNHSTVFDGVDKVFNDNALNDGNEYERFINSKYYEKSYQGCTDEAKLKLAEYGIKAMNFFAIFFASNGQQTIAAKKIIENLKLQI